MKIRKGIVVLVKSEMDEYLLLMQKKSHSFSFISGGVEDGESHVDAAIREAREEVGIKIDAKDLIDTNQVIRFIGSSKGPAEQKVFLYKVKNRLKLIPDNYEISGYEWCTKEEALKKLKEKPPLANIIKSL